MRRNLITRHAPRSVRGHLIVAGLGVLVPIFAVAVVGFALLSSAATRFDELAATARDESSARVAVLDALDTAETRGRALLLAPGPGRAGFREAARAVGVDLPRLNAFGTSEERARQAARDAWRRAQEIVAGAPGEGPSPARERRFEATMDEADAAVLGVAAAANRELDSALSRTRRDQDRIWALLVAQIVGGLVIAGLVVLWVARSLVRPLRRLEHGARRLSGGDLSHRAEPERLTEIAGVAASFNAMAGSLERSRDELQHRADHDELTGLANRTVLEQRGEHALARARRRPEVVSLLFVDLDGFKLINDSLGHDHGDHLLREIGARLRTCTRDTDTVARVGGDEFVVLTEEPADAEHDAGDTATLAGRILDAVRAPVVVDGRPLEVSASVGVATAEPGQGFADLLRDADVAMYAAKERGAGGYELFRADVHEAAVRRIGAVTELRTAVEEESFVLQYQPIVELAVGAVVAGEALVRGRNGDLVAPGAFIPLAEETGLIVPLGRWVLREACREACRWGAGGDAPAPSVTVNLSARQLHDDGILADVRGALAACGLEPGRLVLEMTETAIMHDVDAAVRRLLELRRLGVRLALDDFGTGYSSLSYLRSLPVTHLKIARPFVEDLRTGAPEEAVVCAILELAGGLGLRVVAEGVERDEQAVRLRALACPLAQGFHLGRPTDAPAFRALLASAPASAPAARAGATGPAAPRPAELAALHRRILGHLPDVVVATTDRDGRFTTLDGLGLDAIGWRPEDLLGRTLTETMGDRAGELMDVLGRVLEGEHVEFAWATTRGERQLVIRVEPLHGRDGAIEGALMVARDVSSHAATPPPPRSAGGRGERRVPAG